MEPIQSLNIEFITKDQLVDKAGVKKSSLEKHPSKVTDKNLVPGYQSQDAVSKDRSKGDESPTYTMGAQACTAGYLRVKVGMQPSSDIMFHLLGVKNNGPDPAEVAEKEFSEKIQEYFTSIDNLIRIAKDKGEDLHIDYVTAGSLERSQGKSPPGTEPIQEVMKHSKAVREAVETILAVQTQAFKDRAAEQGVKTTIASSKFANQQSKLDSEIPITPKTNLYFDGKNTLYINAAMAEEAENHQVYLTDATDDVTIRNHYADIILSKNHSATQLQRQQSA